MFNLPEKMPEKMIVWNLYGIGHIQVSTVLPSVRLLPPTVDDCYRQRQPVSVGQNRVLYATCECWIYGFTIYKFWIHPSGKAQAVKDMVVTCYLHLFT
jgi:hypothetical protein